MKRTTIVLSLATTLFSATGAAQGRGNYLNLETPQMRPLAIAQIDNHDYLLVCNTPDNSIEVWDTDESVPIASRFVERIPVGLEPCTVVFDDASGRFHTADFFSDSVTTGTITTGATGLDYTVERTRDVGNEPVHIAWLDGAHIIVTFRSTSEVAVFDAVSLDPEPSPTNFLGARTQLIVPTQAVVGTSTSTPSNVLWAIKEPRNVARAGDRLFVLGHKGGHSSNYDLDLYQHDLLTGNVVGLGGIGTTGFSMTFAQNGDLYVVGLEARNDLTGSAVANAPTGFVQSMLHLVEGAAGGLSAATAVHSRDLHVDPAGGTVAPTQAVSMPTDVVVFEPPSGPSKVLLCGFSSDRIAAVQIGAPANFASWSIQYLDIDPLAHDTAGPRAFALRPARPGVRARLYVMNRLDHSVAIVDPVTMQPVDTFALDYDPTPDYVRAGQGFLYSAEHSGNKFVSCASCHLDGRTDSMLWNLGEPGGFAAPLDPSFIDSPTGPSLQDLIDFRSRGEFSPEKGPMVTQTLQGLLNYEVAPSMQRYVTNAPYHWRGDRADLPAFIEGFENLLKTTDLGTIDMGALEEFVNSIHYPPNPNQELDRRFSGEFGIANQSNTATLAQRGLQAFHTVPIISGGLGRSCVQCHSLPEGSNQHFTDGSVGGTPELPFESAQLRDLFQRERRLDVDETVSLVVTAEFGVRNNGGQHSLNDFIIELFSIAPEDNEAIRHFCRELDWCIGPVVGQVQTVNQANIPPGGSGNPVQQRLDLFIGQAGEANTGLVVRGHLAGAYSGFYYDPIQDRFVDVDATPLQSWSLTQMFALITGPDDQLIFVCVPLGSERRVAALDGQPAPPDGQPASALRILPMVPNTAYRNVPKLTKNWVPSDTPVQDPNAFHWLGSPVPPPHTLHAMRLLQYGLIQNTPGGFGLPALRHDAPRRLRIAGFDLRLGARLLIDTPADTAVPGGPGVPLGTVTTERLELPLFPTAATTSSGIPIWETAVELEPSVYYVMMNGGPAAPGVAAALTDEASAIAEPPPVGMFRPGIWNWHYISIENPSGTAAPQVHILGWQRLTLL